jgi:hypothetical protein
MVRHNDEIVERSVIGDNGAPDGRGNLCEHGVAEDARALVGADRYEVGARLGVIVVRKPKRTPVVKIRTVFDGWRLARPALEKER